MFRDAGSNPPEYRGTTIIKLKLNKNSSFLSHTKHILNVSVRMVRTAISGLGIQELKKLKLLS